jgi:hypothetical protein
MKKRDEPVIDSIVQGTVAAVVVVFVLVFSADY